MAGKNLTIKLTDDQQRQIREATGKSVTELNIGIGAKRDLSEKELDEVAGGAVDNFLYIEGVH